MKILYNMYTEANVTWVDSYSIIKSGIVYFGIYYAFYIAQCMCTWLPIYILFYLKTPNKVICLQWDIDSCFNHYLPRTCELDTRVTPSVEYTTMPASLGCTSHVMPNLLSWASNCVKKNDDRSIGWNLTFCVGIINRNCTTIWQSVND